MLVKKVLTAFSTDSVLDFDLFENLLENSDILQNELLDLSDTDLDLLFKLLIDQRRPLAISKLVALLDKHESEYNHSLVLFGLIKLGFFKSPDDISKEVHLLKELNKHNAFCLKSFFDVFPEKYQKIIEASIALQRENVELFREDLKDQIAFLKTEQLTDKALEIEQKLKFHFPEITETFMSPQQVEKKSQDHNYSNVIERNISFEARSKARKTSDSNKHQEILNAEASVSLELAHLWYSELKNTNPELLLTQLEFINFDNPDFYLKILEGTNLDVWTKIFLFIKSHNYLEGLEFLGKNETNLLTESSDSIYNYYYTKGVMLLGAGMQKEAEEIFLVIKEQKENFRDIQLLLQNAK